MNNRLALIVGHSREDEGSESFEGIGEYSFNKIICESIKRALDFKFGSVLKTEVFYRDGIGRSGVGMKVAKFDPDLSVEFHCNDYDEPAYGTEVLALERDEVACHEAKRLAKHFNDEYGYGLRRDKGLKAMKKTNDNGGTNLWYIERENNKIISLLIEPVFWGLETDQAIDFMKDNERYIRTMCNYFIKFYGLEDETAEPVQSNSQSNLVQQLNATRNIMIQTVMQIDTAVSELNKER